MFRWSDAIRYLKDGDDGVLGAPSPAEANSGIPRLLVVPCLPSRPSSGRSLERSMK